MALFAVAINLLLLAEELDLVFLELAVEGDFALELKSILLAESSGLISS